MKSSKQIFWAQRVCKFFKQKNSMKNIGNVIILVFIAFASMIGYMVYRCMNINTDLVSKEYYKDEIAYQQVIDETSKANQLSSKPLIEKGNSFLTISMPKEMVGKILTGHILFYCPSSKKSDVSVTLHPNEKGVQLISRASFSKMNYIVKIQWSANNTSYYSESVLSLL